MAIDKSQQFTTLVRLGFAARGLTYLLLGYLALRTGGAPREGATGVYDYLRDLPLGSLILWLVALGLLAYALFKLLSAIANIQNRPDDFKGGLKRVGDAASGVVHLFLAYAAYQFATGARSSGGGEQAMAGSVMQADFGSLIIGLVGVGLLIAAAMQAKQAVTGEFMKRIAGDAPRAVKNVGRAGFAARAVVFALTGLSMVRGAWNQQGGAVKGLGEVLLSLRDDGPIYTLVALGLLLFGAFSLATARHRILPDVHRGDLKPDIPRARR
jgi:hypothetical protein